MKKFLLLLFILFALKGYSQFGEFIFNFEYPVYENTLTIDTVSNPENIWQIGPPQKTFFTSAYSPPNVIVTDTLLAYPPNDTSRFYITHFADQGFLYPHTAVLYGMYSVDSDSLSDYGFIEFSPNNGETWVNLLTDTVYVNPNYSWFWEYEKPVLTGNSNGWQSFEVNLVGLGAAFDMELGDTLLYRFGFISDSIQTNRDGLMFDDIVIEDTAEGIDELGYDAVHSECHPNPVSDLLTISFENSEQLTFSLYISDLTGKEVYHSEINTDKVQLPVNQFREGLYFYRLVNANAKKFAAGKFVRR